MCNLVMAITNADHQVRSVYGTCISIILYTLFSVFVGFSLSHRAGQLVSKNVQISGMYLAPSLFSYLNRYIKMTSYQIKLRTWKKKTNLPTFCQNLRTFT